MENVDLYETGHEIFLKQMINKNYPKHLKNIFLSEEDIKSVKTVLTELTSILKWEKNEKIILVDEDTFYTNLAHEVYAYYYKALNQKKSIESMKNMNNYDFTWLYVTQYYYLFFTSCALSRLNNYFVIYLEDDLAAKISNVATTYDGDIKKINGSGTYFIKTDKYTEENNKVKITIISTRDQHVSSLKTLKSFAKKYKQNCVSNSRGLEFAIMKNVNLLLDKKSFNFSNARNYYNYRFETAFQNNNMKLFPDHYSSNDELLWDYFINLDVNSVDIFNSSESLVCVSEYLYQLLYLSIEKMIDLE